MNRAIFILLALTLCLSKLFSQEYALISSVEVIGSNKTSKETILRELPFAEGETILYKSLDSLLILAQNNVNNLSLFNRVQMLVKEEATPINQEIYSTKIIIIVQERWYYWPIIGIRVEDQSFGKWLSRPSIDHITVEAGLKIENIRGKNQSLKALLSTGNIRGINLFFDGIALDSNKNHLFGISFKRNYSKILDVGVADNKTIVLKLDSAALISNFTTNLGYTYRHGIYTRHSLNFTFDYTQLNTLVFEVNPDYWGSKERIRRAYTVNYRYSLDHRNSVSYPTEGLFLSSSVVGYSTNRGDVYLIAPSYTIDYYTPITNSLIIALHNKGRYTLSNSNNYLFKKPVNLEDFYIRGYSKYSLAGHHYFLLSGELIGQIMKQRYFTINVIDFLPAFSKTHLSIYGKLFCDLSYFANIHNKNINSLENKLLTNIGVGVDLATYYDFTASISLSLNHMGESSLSFSLLKPLR